MERFSEGFLKLAFCQITEDEVLRKCPIIAKKIKQGDDVCNDLEEAIINVGLLVNFSPEANLCRDPKDNIFLDTAHFGKANLLVTGDKDLLVLKKYKKIPIISPAEFIKSFA